MFDVKHEWQKSVMKLMQIILEKVCRKNIKINISDERKERNAHVKENWTENAGKKQLATRSILKLLRDKAKGTWQGRKQLFKASVFWMNDAEFTGTWRSLRMTARQNSAAVTDVTLNSTHRKGYQSNFYFFIRRAADEFSEACCTVMTGDRHDGRAAMDFSMIIFGQTPPWLEWILIVMPVWLYFSSFLFSSVLFLNTELYILYEC